MPTITEPSTLFARVALAAPPSGELDRVHGQFPVRVPTSFADRITAGQLDDPLLLQVVPSLQELEVAAGYSTDPLAEAAASPAPGVLHKYEGRALLIVTSVCPIHCRYCFRRHFPYGASSLEGEDLEKALSYVAATSSLREVILSGGDPLSLADERLAALAERLAAIPHVVRLRVHTRWPIVSPERVSASLIEWLTSTRLRPVMVVHSNHAREIGDEVAVALRRLVDSGIPVLNQSVLLRGVNDSADRLRELSERLFECGVAPYYLNLLDPVAGAAHFEVSEAEARVLMRQVEAVLPGYLVPRLVRETPGARAKIKVDR